MKKPPINTDLNLKARLKAKVNALACWKSVVKGYFFPEKLKMTLINSPMLWEAIFTQGYVGNSDAPFARIYTQSQSFYLAIMSFVKIV